ncbi:MAG: LCP family protein [Bacilli bacterium]|nr:LCP family protein [Bacilli bacterium]
MIKKIISIIYLLITLLFIGLLFKIDILPSNILFPIILISIGTSILNIFLLLKFKNTIINTIVLLFVFLISTFYIFGIYQLGTTISFITSINNIKDIENKYYVLVKKDSSYYKIKDIRNKDMGYMNEMDKKVWDKLPIKVKKNKYDNQTNLYNDLIDKKVDSIIVSGAYLYFLEEYNNYLDKDVRIIYSIKVRKSKNKIKIKESNGSFNILVSGIDTYGKISKVSRSDVNIIMSVNPKTGKVLLTHIPRDYYVQLHDTVGYKDKLTHSGIYGVDKTVDTIEDFMEIDIDYYIRINFDTLVKLVDEIGGIDINSDISLNKKNCPIKKGINHLDGKCALAYSRERKAYASGDRHRGENQEQVITVIIKRFSTNKTLILKYNDILKSMDGMFETNFGSINLSTLVKNQIKNNTSWNVESISVDGYDSSNYTYSYYGSKLYVMEPDMETVNIARDKIKEVTS